MTTGTEGPDNLTNDPNVNPETVNALGGDDVITITTPFAALVGTGQITVDGGGGSDTLIINQASRFIGASSTGPSGTVFVRTGSGTNFFVDYSGIERLELSGKLSGQPGSLVQTGDEVDILHIDASFGGTIESGGGNDEVYVTGGIGGTAIVIDGGTGNDLIDLTGMTAPHFPLTDARGGDGDDTIRGSSAFEILEGGAGNDTLLGNGVGFPGWYDQYVGGAGNDTITGGGAAVDIDWIRYDLETGANPVYVNLSSSTTVLGAFVVSAGTARDSFGDTDTLSNIDKVTGTAGADWMLGGAGTDRFEGQAGADTLYGNGGADELVGGAGNDSLFGGAQDGTDGADDWVLYSNELGGSGVAVNLSSSSATVGGVLLAAGTARDSYGNTDTLTGIEFVRTTPLDDSVLGSAGGNRIETSSGNDYIDGGGGGDTMVGGFGNDIYIVRNVADVIIENDGEGTDEVRTTIAAYTLTDTFIENLVGLSDSGQALTGNNVANRIQAAGGNDVVRGGGGNDFLLSGAGSDQLFGDDGNDVFFFGRNLDGSDSADGGAGLDQIALQGNQPVTFGTGVVNIESLAILSGLDQRFGDTDYNLYDYDITTRDVNVAAGVQLVVDANRLVAGEDLTFNGSAETDGSFFIYGGGGTDTLTGGAGNDVFLFGVDGQWGSNDRVVGGAGIDQLALRGNYTVTFGANQLVGIESIGLLSAHDTRFGPLGSSYSYNLTMNDANVAAGVQMTVDGAKLRIAENFTFNGAAEQDGTFRVFGGLVNDTITGGQGNDIIQGNAGADTLTGSGGADTFVYALGDSQTGSVDHITDFDSGSDKIDLTRIDANLFVPGDQAFTWIGSAAFTGSGSSSAGELRAYDNGTNWVVEGDVNGDGIADVVINVTTSPPDPLVQSDFLL